MKTPDEELFEMTIKDIMNNNLICADYLNRIQIKIESGSIKEQDWILLVENQVEFEEEVSNEQQN